MRHVQIFSWGYWGWGTAADRFVEMADAVESARGRTPPLFIDVRIRRSVRAPQFSGDGFRKVVGDERYEWWPELGNIQIAEGGRGPTRIAEPEAAERLLELAVERSATNQHIIYFCACEFPWEPDPRGNPVHCHRVEVADLLLVAARKHGLNVAIAEWPGGEPVELELRVTGTAFQKVLRGGKSIPLGLEPDLARYGAIPWRSIVTVTDGDRRLPVATGPAKYSKAGWFLPVPWDTANPNAPVSEVRHTMERFKDCPGYGTRGNSD